MKPTFECTRLSVMTERHMPHVMAIQACCYRAIEPESLAAMEAKRVASAGLAHVAEWHAATSSASPPALAPDAETPTSGPAAADTASALSLSAYVIAMPIRWPELPSLNSEPAPAQQPDTLYVHDLAIHPSVRGTGLGARLLRAVDQRAQALGLTQAALVAIQGSVPFWQRQGFVCVPTPVELSEKLNSYGKAQLMVRDMVLPA